MYLARIYWTDRPGKLLHESEHKTAPAAWDALAVERRRDHPIASQDHTLRRLEEMSEFAKDQPRTSCGVVYGPTDPETGRGMAYWVELDRRD